MIARSSVVAVFRPGTGFKSRLAAAHGVAVTTASTVPESSVPQAGEETLVTSVADAPDGKKKAAARSGEKKAVARSGEKAGKKADNKASKASKKKPGRKAGPEDLPRAAPPLSGRRHLGPDPG